MQVAIKTYQASESAFKNPGPTGLNALGGRMRVLFDYLRLRSENPRVVVTIDQIQSVLRGEIDICGLAGVSMQVVMVSPSEQMVE